MAKTIKLLPPKKVLIEKYRLQEFVNDLPNRIPIQSIEKILADEHKISKHQFWSDRKIKLGSDQSIPGDRLAVYAKLFDCTIEELMNQTIKAKPLFQSRIKTSLR